MEWVVPLGHHGDVDWVEEDPPQPDMAQQPHSHRATEPAVGFTRAGQRPGTNGTLGGGSFYKELCPLLKPQQAPQPGAPEWAEWQHRDQEGAPFPTPIPPVAMSPHKRPSQSLASGQRGGQQQLTDFHKSVQLRHSGAPALSRVWQGILGKWRAPTSQESVT